MPHLIGVSVGVAPQRDVFHALFVVSSLPLKARGWPVHPEKWTCQAGLPLSSLCLTKDIKELLSGIVFDDQIHRTREKLNKAKIFGFLVTN